MNDINFTGKYIKDIPVAKMNSIGNYFPTSISLVKLDSRNPNDVDSLFKTASMWSRHGSEYAFDTYNDLVKEYPYVDVIKEHYFVATTQKSHFSKLNPDKILGVSLFSEKKGETNHLDYLDVKPTTKHGKKHQPFKGIGKAILDYYKETFTDKPIELTSSNEAVEFYKKQNFIPDKNKTCVFTYTA